MNKLLIFGLTLVLLMSMSVIHAENETIIVNNSEIAGTIEINDNNLHVHGETTENLSEGSSIDLTYSEDDMEYDYLKDEKGQKIYPIPLKENENFDETFSGLKNGFYDLWLGEEYHPFIINLPASYNLTTHDNQVQLTVFTNDNLGYLSLLDSDDEFIDDVEFSEPISQWNYTLTNGEYKFELYHSMTFACDVILFKIDVPVAYNVTMNGNNVSIEVNANDDFDYELLDSKGNEIDADYCEYGMRRFDYSLPNDDYIFRITDQKNLEIPFTIKMQTDIEAYSDKNNIVVNINANPLDTFKVYVNDKLESRNYRNNVFNNLKNGNYTVKVYENDEMVWENIFEIKEYNAKIATKQNLTFAYGSDSLIYATIEQNSKDGSAKPVLVYNGKTIKGTEKKANQFAFKFNKPAGKYKIQLQLDDGTYYAEPVNVNVVIAKATSVVTVKKAYSTTKSYVKLRAFVDDQDGMYVNEGVVNFAINGKTYSVKVKDGEAIKKIKLTKAKTYTLKTTFSSENYKTKSVSSKVVVSKAKKYYLIKVGKYSCKVSFKDYLKILDAKSWNSVFSKTYNTRKTIKIKYYTYKTKKVTYTKKKLLAHSWISKGKIYSRSYASANIAPKGYKYAGAKIVQKGYDVKEYQIYKKTVKKKIKSKAKYKTCKVYISIDTYRWSKNHDVKAMACTDSSYLMNLDKDYNYYSKEKVL